MIQRIQTIWLVLAVVACFMAAWMVTGIQGVPDRVPILAVAVLGLAGAAGLAAIFLYGNRKRQRGLILACQWITVVGLAIVVEGLFRASMLPTIQSMTVHAWWGAGLPVAGYVLFLLARRGVEGDIKLIESVDRLR